MLQQPSKNKRRPISALERTEWSEIGQVGMLQSFCDTLFWRSPDYAFQGGTSLRIMWGSPRYSEDLDFLVSDQVSGTLSKDMAKVTDRFKEWMARVDPNFQITFSDKTSNESRMLVYYVTLAKPDVIGNVRVKLEFWQVKPEYLEKYQTALRSPIVPFLDGYRLRVDCHVSSSTLKSVFVDKLGAIGSRPYLKMRDFFDIWWIRRHQNFERPSDLELLDRYMHHLTAYRSDKAPVHALGDFLVKTSDVDFLVKKAETDLKSFLPSHVWNMFYPDEVRNMILATREEAQRMIDVLASNKELVAEKMKLIDAVQLDAVFPVAEEFEVSFVRPKP